MNQNLRFKLYSSPVIGKFLIERNLDYLLSFRSTRWKEGDELGNEIKRQFHNFLTGKELSTPPY